MKIHLIANPVSGGDARPRIARAATWLRGGGASVEVHLTARRGDAERFAADALGRCDRVVVAGGDGTLNEVANALHGSALPLAFLPLGTVNVFALETGIPLDLEGACRLALHGRARPISLGRIDERVFLLMASAGWDAAAVARLRPGLKRRCGRLAYLVSAVEALLAQPPAEVTITLADGRRRSGSGVVVSNARCYGGRYVITPQASLGSATLEVGLLRCRGRLALLGCALRLGLRRPLAPAAIEYHRVSAVTISGGAVPVQVDGDPWGTLPVTVAALPRGLQVVLPESFREGDDDGKF